MKDIMKQHRKYSKTQLKYATSFLNEDNTYFLNVFEGLDEKLNEYKNTNKLDLESTKGEKNFEDSIQNIFNEVIQSPNLEDMSLDENNFGDESINVYFKKKKILNDSKIEAMKTKEYKTFYQDNLRKILSENLNKFDLNIIEDPSIVNLVNKQDIFNKENHCRLHQIVSIYSYCNDKAIGIYI